MDVAWVVGAGLVLVAFPGAIDNVGRLTLAAATIVVAVFAFLQTRALRVGTKPPS